MAYSTGMMNKRVKIAKRVDSEGGSFGRSSGGQKYTMLGEFWAAESFNKGVKSLREGAVDAYDTVMFRMRYHAEIDRWCLVQYHGRWYQIQSFNEDYQTNEIQITAIEMANQNVTIVEPNINNSNS
jgi:SPP1 family predicted phage head-tail adaptor